MTEKLKQLMHERATSMEFVPPDLDLLTREGDRRVRRRRGMVVVGGLAAGAVLAGVVAIQLGGAEDPVVATSPPPAAPLTWVTGSVLHTPDGETDLGIDVRAYVRTADGYVVSDRDGIVWSWRDGEATEVGRTDPRRPHLVSDDEAALAGWVDAGGGSPAFAVLDQDTGKVTTYDGDQGPTGGAADQFWAIDAGTAYWKGPDGPLAVDLGSGRTTAFPVDGQVADVEDDLVAARTDAGISVRTTAGRELRMLSDFYGELGSFSQDARFFTNDADEPQVFDLAAGERRELDVAGRAFATGYEWLGSGTLAVIAAEEASDTSTAELLVCEVPSGSCEAVAALGTFEEIADTLVLPVGEATDS